jgi:hypothetical protein
MTGVVVIARRVALVSLVGAFLTTCAGTTTPATTRSPSAPLYIVRSPDEWSLKRALNPAPDSLASRVEPSLDWFAEYERRGPVSDEGRYTLYRVRLSGHFAAVERQRDNLHGLVGERSVVIAGKTAISGRLADPIGPEVVLIRLSDTYSAVALSYELTGDDLVAWCATLRDASEAEWVASGGTIER